ncbi:DNA ligase 1-like [Vicia villosa]|uniref:DNA ligase 1-like n=1 Tax=Vicia villosa TaxID=3911 RepID=UPI00273C3F04|nr:DNA ligase 1-like [Vicia villosa]
MSPSPPPPSPPPSAIDALMSGARAASKKKHPPIEKKRKTPHSTSQNPKNLKTLKTLQKPEKPAADREPPKNILHKAPSSSSSSLSSTSKELIADLKERVLLLSNSPSKFNPCTVAYWEKGKPVPFLFLCLAFNLIGEEDGRIKKTEIACNLLRTVIHATPEDLLPIVYLFSGTLAPPQEGLELRIGEPTINTVIAEAYGTTEKRIKEWIKEDKLELELVAQSRRLSQSMLRKPESLTVRKVFKTFHLIAKESGKNSQEKRKNHIKSLLFAATDREPVYLYRLLKKDLNIKCDKQTLLSALGHAAVYTEEHSKVPPEIQSPLEEAESIVKEAYSVSPDFNKIVSALLTDGVWLLPKKCSFTVGDPVQPMLAKPINCVSDALTKFKDIEIACEYKYDGERAQIHYMENGSVEIYSRNSKRITGEFPDVVAAVSRLRKTNVSSFVLDCELVAYDRAKQKILPLQTLSSRARKDVNLSDIKVDVCIFAFDLLFLNGQALLQKNLKTRREYLYASFEEESGFLQFGTSLTSNDAKEIQKFLDQAVSASCEGLIFKPLSKSATYVTSQKSRIWLKLKKDYQDKIGDTLDLVPIGAYYGRGKRKGVYGSFLLACYDNENEEFQAMCNIGTGFTDAKLKELFDILRSKVIMKPKANYRYNAEKTKPDVWFEDSEVFEVKASDLTCSLEYQAAIGLVYSDKGISLRFPRLVRVRTANKAPDQASSSKLVAEMYKAQAQKQESHGQSKMTNKDEDESHEQSNIMDEDENEDD